MYGGGGSFSKVGFQFYLRPAFVFFVKMGVHKRGTFILQIFCGFIFFFFFFLQRF